MTNLTNRNRANVYTCIQGKKTTLRIILKLVKQKISEYLFLLFIALYLYIFVRIFIELQKKTELLKKLANDGAIAGANLWKNNVSHFTFRKKFKLFCNIPLNAEVSN